MEPGEKPTHCIPKGLYCYVRLSEPDSSGKSKVAYCPYMGTFVNPLFEPLYPDEYEEWITYCAFLEIAGGILLSDSCKECGENDGFDD